MTPSTAAAVEELCTVILAEARLPEVAFPTGALLAVQFVASPLIRETLDFRFADGVGPGASQVRIGLTSSELGVADRTRAILEATEFVGSLLEHGAIAVVVHAAGDVVFSAAAWEYRTQLRRERNWLPALAWTDLRNLDGELDGWAVTRGLDAFGLPDVAVPSQWLLIDSEESWARAREAAFAAACAMVARGAPLADGEVLHVVAGTEFSGGPLSVDNPGLDEACAKSDPFADWRVERIEGGRLRLVGAVQSIAARMEAFPGPLPYPSYRWLFVETLRDEGFEKIAAITPPQLAGLPVHEVFVFERDGVFITSTCGLGRIAQPGGTVKWENEFVEFAVQLPTHNPHVALAIAFLAISLHGGEPSHPIARTHRVAIAPGVIRFPYPWFVLGSLPDLDLGGGEPIRLYQPLLMTQQERDAIPSDELDQWIEKFGDAALTRWLHRDVSIPLTMS